MFFDKDNIIIYEPRREKTASCICENKGADQLRSVRCNREADQRLCFSYIDSIINLLPKSEISSLQPSLVLAQFGLCWTRLEMGKTGFLTTRLIFMLLFCFLFQHNVTVSISFPFITSTRHSEWPG